jgi:hypothetical protein
MVPKVKSSQTAEGLLLFLIPKLKMLIYKDKVESIGTTRDRKSFVTFSFKVNVSVSVVLEVMVPTYNVF